MSNQKSTQHESIKQIAIFASGAGSNAKNIIKKFSNYSLIKVALVVCNKPAAGVVQIARDLTTEVLIIDKIKFFEGNGYVPELKNKGIDFIVLAGFLWKMPATLVHAFANRIINIHPALLPKYGGKGMYGLKVHEAVISANETQSGITIHYVDEKYDNGDIIFQATCPVLPTDTPETLAERIHVLEYENYPTVIENCVNQLSS